MNVHRLRTLLLGLTALVALTAPAAAERVLLHVKTSLSKDDAQICVAPNVALAALEEGDGVTLLFDGSAVTSITKGWGWFTFGETTPMDGAALPKRERESLSQQFGIPLGEVPGDYGAYLRWLEGRGAKVFVNRTMLTLYGIDTEDVIVAKPLALKEMLGVFRQADRVLVY